MAVTVIARTTGCDRANVGGSTSTFASRFAHRPLSHSRGCRGTIPNGNSVYRITDMQAAQQRNFGGVKVQKPTIGWPCAKRLTSEVGQTRTSRHLPDVRSGLPWAGVATSSLACYCRSWGWSDVHSLRRRARPVLEGLLDLTKAIPFKTARLSVKARRLVQYC
jgi:hypothetical protein